MTQEEAWRYAIWEAEKQGRRDAEYASMQMMFDSKYVPAATPPDNRILKYAYMLSYNNALGWGGRQLVSERAHRQWQEEQDTLWQAKLRRFGV